jgi:ribosomal protein S27E
LCFGFRLRALLIGIRHDKRQQFRIPHSPFRIGMQVTVKCPGCDSALVVNARDAVQTICCGGCGREIALDVSSNVREDRSLDRCPVCGGADFYGRKDFDPKLGLAVVVIGALISAGFYWFGLDLVAYGILAAAVLIDLVIYYQLGEVTVCYRCHTEFRGRYPKTAPAFDLHTADVLEQEYERRIGRR